MDAVTAVLRSTRLSMGPQTSEFERMCADLTGATSAVAVSSGTAGLHLCLVAGDVGAGDLVITTPFSFVASANVVLYERAVPVFVDIDAETLNLDPALVADAADALAAGGAGARRWLPRRFQGAGESMPRSLKAVLPVHAFGRPADMGSVLETARRHELLVIEDACEGLGTVSDGRSVGTWGDAGVFAFYPNKQITTGEGGMVVTSRPEWADLLRSLRNQGRGTDGGWLVHERLGYNYRIDEMSAALGVVQLRRLPDLLAARARVARWYEERLRAVETITLPAAPGPSERIAWFVYVVQVAEDIDRDAVIAGLSAAGIESRPYFVPIHLQPFYRARFGYREGDFPVTEAVARRALALPFFGGMTEAEVDDVCEHLRATVGAQAVRA